MNKLPEETAVTEQPAMFTVISLCQPDITKYQWQVTGPVEFRDVNFHSLPEAKAYRDQMIAKYTRPATDPAKDVEGLVKRLQSKAKELLEHRHATASWLMQEAAQSTAAQSELIKMLVDAIDTGRNEPLMIARDTARNFLEDNQ